ncbi:MAG: hypothetical protein NE328_11470 [Lentisphaeraceae bacterium]|nr:hypothetical protein [Lentisphaeraceae bacterium]
MKKILFIVLLVLSFQSYAQIKDYVDRIRLVEKFGNENNIPLGDISAAELAKIMRFAGGLAASAADATIIQTEIGKLDTFIDSLGGSNATVSGLPASIKNNLSAKAAANLVNLINNGQKDPTPQNFLASQISLKRNIAFIVSELFKEILKEATRPSRPVSPTSLSLKRIFKRTTKIQKVRLPQTSGDYLSNAFMSIDYAYTEYDDRSIGNSGQIHDWGLSLHGTILDGTDLSFGFIGNEGEANGSIANDFRSETYGFDSMIHHKLNENFGFGVFGFYQHTRYEKLDTKDYGAGFGFLFSTWHDLGIVEVSTVHSWTKAYYEAGNDTLWNSAVEVTRFWTDRFSTSLRAAFTDSLDSDVSGDNTYWTLGGSIGYMLTDKVHVTVGFYTDEAIRDYDSRTWNIGLSYYF